jgi:hypothetical protein
MKDDDRQPEVRSQYAVEIEGNSIDLCHLRETFQTGPVRVTEIDVAPDRQISALIAEEFDGVTDGALVLEIARRLVTLINGTLFASDAQRSVLRPSVVYRQDADGIWRGTDYLTLNGILAPIRVNSRVTVSDPDGTPVPPSNEKPSHIRWLDLASTDTPEGDRVADVLHALAVIRIGLISGGLRRPFMATNSPSRIGPAMKSSGSARVRRSIVTHQPLAMQRRRESGCKTSRSRKWTWGLPVG